MLKKIGEIEIGEDTTLHVAKNGIYQLICQEDEDIYGTPIYKLYDLDSKSEDSLRLIIYHLVQSIGKLLSEKQAVADSRRATLQGTKSEE